MKWLCAWLLAFTTAACAGTVEDVRSSGVLTCGLDPARPGFSVRAENYRWTGFDVDLCRAIAAAVIGDGQKVNMVALSAEERIVALQSGEIDVLLHGVAWTPGVDAKNGLMFVVPTFDATVDGQRIVYGPLVRQGDDQWFHVIRNLVMALTNPAQTADAELDKTLQLDPGWQGRALAVGGSYAESFARHFGPDTAFKLSSNLPFAPP